MITIKHGSTIIGTIGKLERTDLLSIEHDPQLFAYNVVLFPKAMREEFGLLKTSPINIMFYKYFILLGSCSNFLIEDGDEKYKCRVMTVEKFKEENDERATANVIELDVIEWYVSDSSCSFCKSEKIKILPPKSKRDNPFFALINKIRNIF